MNVISLAMNVVLQNIYSKKTVANFIYIHKEIAIIFVIVGIRRVPNICQTVITYYSQNFNAVLDNYIIILQ